MAIVSGFLRKKKDVYLVMKRKNIKMANAERKMMPKVAPPFFINTAIPKVRARREESQDILILENKEVKDEKERKRNCRKETKRKI